MGLLDIFSNNSMQGDYGPVDAPNDPGLLSGVKTWMQDPRNAAGLMEFGRALAQAGAPRRGPSAGWGGGLSDALAGFNSGREGFDKKSLEKMMQKLQAQKLQEDVTKSSTVNSAIKSAMQANQGGEQSSVAYPPMAEMVGMPSPQVSGGGMGAPGSIEYLLAMAKDDVPSMLKAAEIRATGFNRDPGKQYLGPNGWVQPADAKSGLGMDASGNSTLAPNFASNNAAVESAKTTATEEAKRKVGMDTPQVFSGMGPGGGPVYGTPNALMGNTVQTQSGLAQGNFGGSNADLSKAQAAIEMMPDGPQKDMARMAYAKQLGGNAKPRSGGLVTGANPIETAAAESFAKDFTKTANSNIEQSYSRALAASQQAPAIKQLEDAIKSGKIISGVGANQRITVAQLANTFGNDNSAEGLAQTRAAIQGMSELALQSRGMLKGQGQVSDMEQKVLSAARAGNINFTIPEINALINIFKRASVAAQESHKMLMNKLPDSPEINKYKSMFTVEEPSKSVMKFDAQGNLLP